MASRFLYTGSIPVAQIFLRWLIEGLKGRSMTTIVYNHKDKEIAFDSRCTNGSYIISDEVKKMHKVCGGYLFISGDMPDIEDFLLEFDWKKVKCKKHYNIRFIGVREGTVYYGGVNGGCIWFYDIKTSISTGSGEDYAIAAIDMGKSAKEAVEYAMTRDSLTGGKVGLFSVSEGKVVD